eukprot:TRINITY_DN12396_c0_g3_i1.p1 TRINITY_DN12396_c0_g3~~TRINITY_DN12396_c0_g3_i1.p1  ORF type:complete len:226 (-),score=29.36 TRINITY_DN12396_c0_g3_i1:135-758(-)
MDAYSLEKRKQDGICSLTLNDPRRLQQRALSASKLETLKQELEQCKEFNKKAKEDWRDTMSNCKAQQKAIKQSYDWGGPRYTHVPPNDSQNSEYAGTMQGLHDRIAEQQAKHDSITKLMAEDYKGVRNTQPDQSVSGFAGWFAKYGTPKREEKQEERFRTISHTQRRRLHSNGEFSNAKSLRYGAGIWRQRSETDLKGTWNFHTAGH